MSLAGDKRSFIPVVGRIIIVVDIVGPVRFSEIHIRIRRNGRVETTVALFISLSRKSLFLVVNDPRIGVPASFTLVRMAIFIRHRSFLGQTIKAGSSPTSACPVGLSAPPISP